MTPYDTLFAKYAAKSGVPQALIEATARTESSLNPRALAGESGGRHSYGLFQLLDTTARSLGFTGPYEQLFDPETNTDLATRHMAGIIRRQGGINKLSLPSFYSEYNSGRAGLWQTSEEVFSHVQNFLANYAVSIPAAVGDNAPWILLVLALGLVFKFAKKK